MDKHHKGVRKSFSWDAMSLKIIALFLWRYLRDTGWEKMNLDQQFGIIQKHSAKNQGSSGNCHRSLGSQRLRVNSTDSIVIGEGRGLQAHSLHGFLQQVRSQENPRAQRKKGLQGISQMLSTLCSQHSGSSSGKKYEPIYQRQTEIKSEVKCETCS